MREIRPFGLCLMLTAICVAACGCGSGVQQVKTAPGGVKINPPADVANNPNIPDKVKGAIPNH